MHPDLEHLMVADRYDRQIRDLRKKKATQLDILAKAEARDQAARERLAGLVAAIDANKARQRELNREVESYEARRRSATRILENGTGDAAAAERQLASVAEVLDTLETELLEKMEALEELESERTQAAADAADAAAFLEAEKAGHDGKIAALKAKFTAILPEREATLALLDKTILGRYETLLSRRGRAIAEIVDGSCSGCQRVVRQQNIADLQRGLMYACDGCGRWLLPPDPG